MTLTPVVVAFPAGCPAESEKKLIDRPGAKRVETGDVNSAGLARRVVVYFENEALAAEFAKIVVATIPGAAQAL